MRDPDRFSPNPKWFCTGTLRPIGGVVGLVLSFHHTLVGISWNKVFSRGYCVGPNFFIVVFRGSKIVPHGYFVGPNFFLWIVCGSIFFLVGNLMEIPSLFFILHFIYLLEEILTKKNFGLPPKKFWIHIVTMAQIHKTYGTALCGTRPTKFSTV